jgi:mannose-6-phosphate isomerase-like protein (cupin superfamily)
VLSEGDDLPAWSELRWFRVERRREGEWTTHRPTSERQKLIVATGRVALHREGESRELRAGEQADLNGLVESSIRYLEPGVTVLMSGRWGETTGGSGLFSVTRSDEPKDIGDSVEYPKETDFDSHYHDCDEFWIIVSGSGTAVSEGRLYHVGPGDCIATRMGHHHDFPRVDERVSAVYFETTLRGRARRGHLWEHTHGPAVPAETVV